MGHQNRKNYRHQNGKNSVQQAQKTASPVAEKSAEVMIENKEYELRWTENDPNFRTKEMLLMALNSPKTDQSGFSIPEMELRERLREKLKAVTGERFSLTSQEYNYLKKLIRSVNYRIEAKAIIEFVKNF